VVEALVVVVVEEVVEEVEAGVVVVLVLVVVVLVLDAFAKRAGRERCLCVGVGGCGCKDFAGDRDGVVAGDQEEVGGALTVHAAEAPVAWVGVVVAVGVRVVAAECATVAVGEEAGLRRRNAVCS
jgi:hypothetical protein